MKSLSLVLFSVLTQAAVGTVAVSLSLFYLPGSGAGSAVAAAARLAFMLALCGTASSLAHLGSPLGAYRALANLRTSWLSREVLLTSLFTLGAAVYGFGWTTRPAGAVLTAIGLLALYAQGMVYQLPTRPEWRHGSNLWSGFGAALLLGALLAALLVGLGGMPAPAVLGYLGAVAIIACSWLLLGMGLYLVYLVRVSRHTAALLLGDTWFWVRLVAGMILPALSGLGLVMGLQPDLLTTGGALLAAVVGELLGRSLFYRTVLDQLPLF